MIKYEKPMLIDIRDEIGLDTTKGACSTGTTNIEQCGNGGNVIPGCMGGFAPAVKCANGSTV